MTTSVPTIPKPKPSPPGGWAGWRSWCASSPYQYDFVEAWREEWPQSYIVSVFGDPTTNVANLYWRPVAWLSRRKQRVWRDRTPVVRSES